VRPTEQEAGALTTQLHGNFRSAAFIITTLDSYRTSVNKTISTFEISYKLFITR